MLFIACGDRGGGGGIQEGDETRKGRRGRKYKHTQAETKRHTETETDRDRDVTNLL